MTSARRCVIAGGGAVGMLFARHLADTGCEVCVVDLAGTAQPGHRSTRLVRGDITTIGPGLAAEIRSADLVILAVPERVASTALADVARAMAADAVLVDTLSVKKRIVDLVPAAAPGVQMVSLNPMFAPALGIAGRPVAAVVVRDGPRVRHLLQLIGSWGGRVVRMTADEHDRLTGAAQALTHAAVLAFGLALADLDLDIAELGLIAPPPHRTQLALLARICGGTPEVYWDVQSANPHARRARTALAAAVGRLAGLIDTGDEAGFAALLRRLRDVFGPELERYGDLCARAFGVIDRVPDRTPAPRRGPAGPPPPPRPPVVAETITRHHKEEQ